MYVKYPARSPAYMLNAPSPPQTGVTLTVTYGRPRLLCLPYMVEIFQDNYSTSLTQKQFIISHHDRVATNTSNAQRGHRQARQRPRSHILLPPTVVRGVLNCL